MNSSLSRLLRTPDGLRSMGSCRGALELATIIRCSKIQVGPWPEMTFSYGWPWRATTGRWQPSSTARGPGTWARCHSHRGSDHSPVDMFSRSTASISHGLRLTVPAVASHPRLAPSQENKRLVRPDDSRWLFGVRPRRLIGQEDPLTFASAAEAAVACGRRRAMVAGLRPHVSWGWRPCRPSTGRWGIYSKCRSRCRRPMPNSLWPSASWSQQRTGPSSSAPMSCVCSGTDVRPCAGRASGRPLVGLSRQWRPDGGEMQRESLDVAVGSTVSQRRRLNARPPITGHAR
jgi:hypothetical protein